MIEAFVPDVTRFTDGQVNWATKVTADRVELDVGRHDPANATSDKPEGRDHGWQCTTVSGANTLRVAV